jgi:hypothetical protein
VKRWLAALLASLALIATASASELRITARETARLPYAGVVAAFAVDSSTVEASALNGEVVMHARRAGHTLVTVVLPTTVETLSVTVDRAALGLQELAGSPGKGGGSWDARYDSGTSRYSTGLTANFGEGERTTRLRVEAMHQRPRFGSASISALPFASVEFESPRRSVTLLDQFVRSSPLTLGQVMLRGVHLRQGALTVHAGVASTTPFDDLLVPSRGDRALGVSLRIPRGALNIVPRLLWLPDSKDAAGVVSLGVERGASGERLQYRGELGWGGRPGASFDVQFDEPRRRIWATGAVRPQGFATLNSGTSAGSHVDAGWSEALGDRTTAGVSLSASRLNVAGSNPATASVRADVHHQVSEPWSLTAAIVSGGYRSMLSTLTRSTFTAGTSYQGGLLGITAQYRYQDTSASARGGHGGRLSIHGRGRKWQSHFYVDAQQQATTLDLVLQDRSDLARAIAELNITARDPEDVIRMLRDNAALLAARGVSLGPLRLNARRVQTGLDVSWRDDGVGGLEIGLRLLADDIQAVASSRRAFVGTVYANWRVTRDTDVGISYSRWSLRNNLSDGGDQDSVQLTLRTRFSSLALPGAGLGAISGRVVRDDAERTVRPPLAGIEVVLDRNRRTRTDAEGGFTFERPGAGAHQVEAVLPQDPGAYFTSPSTRTIKPGGEAQFSITFSAARLSGTVRSDAGLPLGGVTLRVDGSPQSTTTDSQGAYRFAAPAGEVRVVVVAESLPAGYELRELAPKRVALAPGAPGVADFTIRAQRAIEGVVSATGGRPVRVLALEAGREVTTDGSGRFLLRALPAGPVTLVVKSPRGETRQQVSVPAEPGLMKGIKLAAP